MLLADVVVHLATTDKPLSFIPLSSATYIYIMRFGSFGQRKIYPLALARAARRANLRSDKTVLAGPLAFRISASADLRRGGVHMPAARAVLELAWLLHQPQKEPTELQGAWALHHDLSQRSTSAGFCMPHEEQRQALLASGGAAFVLCTGLVVSLFWLSQNRSGPRGREALLACLARLR